MATTCRIAIISPVPFFFQAPLYRVLASDQRIDLTVLYRSGENLHHADPTKWYGPKNARYHNDNFLEGYYSVFSQNIWRELRAKKYDMVVLQSWGSPWWWLVFLMCKFLGQPVFFMSDANVAGEDKKTFYKKIVKQIFLRTVFALADGCLVAGSANERFYRYYGVPASKMTYFPYWWGYDSLIASALPVRSPATDDILTYLYVGRLSPEKGLLDLVAAFHSIKHERKRLVLVGDGPVRASLEQYIKDVNVQHIEITGFKNRQEVLAYYQQADVLVLPSRFEPWGMVVAEALCFGLPVIVSDAVGAGTDLVKEGYNGYVYPADDQSKLVDCLAHFAKLDLLQRQKLSQHSKEVIIEWIKSMNPVDRLMQSFTYGSVKKAL